jgi:thymidine kinase
MDFSDGKLEIVLGTMFSGKTSHMISKISFFADLGFKILYLNIEFDNRTDSAFSTHNPFINTKEYEKKGNIQKNVTMLKTKTLENIPFDIYDIVIIDEAHFFADLVKYTKKLLEAKKYVIVGSLIADFKGKKFGNVYDLIPICDDIKRLQAYCGICAQNKKYRVAIYSKRMSESEETIEIGGSEKYIPVCREHFTDSVLTNDIKLNKTKSIESIESIESVESIKKHIIVENDFYNQKIDLTNFSQFI